jgi:hypothetical protein
VIHLRRSVGSPVAWAATAVFIALMVLWTVITPAFRSPDEPQHVNSVVRLVEGGGWPEPADAHMSPEVLRAKTLSGFSAVDGQAGNWAGGTLLPGVRPGIAAEDLIYFALYSAQEPTPPGERRPFRDLSLTQDVDLGQYPDQMTQHPPLYYALTAGVVTMALMRLVGVLLVAPIPLLAWSTVVRLTGRRRLGDVAAVLPLGIPQLAVLGGSVTNDALVVLLGGLLSLMLARVLTGDRSWPTVVGTGLVLGLALLTKGTMLVAVPVVGLALVVGARRAVALPWGQVFLRLGVAWAVAFVVGGWWWAVNLLRYGTVQPAGWSQEFSDQFIVDGPRDSVPAFTGQFADKLATTFWGHFGQLELALPLPLVAILTVGLIGCCLLAFRRGGQPATAAVLLALVVLMVALLYPQTYLGHLYNGQYAGIQGRYLYGGLVALLAVAVIGIGTLVRAEGRAERWTPPVVLALALAVAGYSLWFAFRGFYMDIDWTVGRAWQRMVDWSPWPRWAVDGLVLGVAGLAAAALVVAVVQAARTGGSDPDPRDDAEGYLDHEDDGAVPARTGSSAAGSRVGLGDRLHDTAPVAGVRPRLNG